METNFRNTNLDNIESATIVERKNALASVFGWMSRDDSNNNFIHVVCICS
jgi:hypothetical protein